MDIRRYGMTGTVLLALAATGCASQQGAARDNNLHTQVALLDTRLTALEQRQGLIEGKAENQREDVSSLKGKAEGQNRGMTYAAGAVPATVDGERSKLSIHDIQQALKNAGFNPGPVDGRLGRRTRSAIRDFQQAHGLKVDGVVGPQTRTTLIPYLTGSRQAGVPKY